MIDILYLNKSRSNDFLAEDSIVNGKVKHCRVTCWDVIFRADVQSSPNANTRNFNASRKPIPALNSAALDVLLSGHGEWYISN